MKSNRMMKNTALSVALGLALGIVGANADEGDSNAVAEHFKKNYSYAAQVGAQYTQGYYGEGESKNNFQSLYAYLGFEGVEFERLRFGLNLMGSVKLGKSRAVYDQDIRANAILYQGFIGYTSEYFDLSAGREELDLEWVNDYVEGARFAIKIPQGATTINAYWFYRQAVADNNEISQFEDGKVGHTIIAGIENNSWEPLAIEAYFVNVDSATKYAAEEPLPSFNGAWVGANLSFGSEDSVLSNTSVKYTYLHSKMADWLDAHFLQVEEDLLFSLAESHSLGLKVGVMKVFNKKSDLENGVVPLNALGDQRPLDKGDEYLYNSNALTAYVGLGYNFADYFGLELIYGNTSGINGNINGGAAKEKPLNAVELNVSGGYEGLEAGISYTKLINTASGESKINRDYFEAFVAYNF